MTTTLSALGPHYIVITDGMHMHMGEMPEAEQHINMHMNEMTEVEQPDRKRQRGPRGVRGQGHRTGRARAHNED